MPRSAFLPTALAALVLASCGTPAPEPAASSDAAPLAVHFEVLDNHQDGAASFQAALTLTNRGSAVLESEGWELYFNFGRMLAAESFPESVAASHVNGDLFKIAPTDAFAPLAPGESLRLPFTAGDWVIKEGEAPAGPYLVLADGTAHALPEVTVAPFVDPRQTGRVAGDRVPVPTPASRYEANRELTQLPADDLFPIVPTPVRLTQGDAEVTLDASWEIRFAAGLEGEARHLAEGLEAQLGTAPKTVEATDAGAQAIVLTTGGVDGAEAYRLTVGAENGIAVTGGGAAGVFYGVRSLLALIEPSPESRPRIALPEVTVDDAPRFAYRGMHLDVSRNFHSAESVKKLLDLMAFYKLNRFHFHLTDDEGWRLPVAALPELTEIGGRRGHTTDERDRLVPSFGSGPDPDASHGSGAYTREEFVDILRHAHARHIEVIPEIDVPGHARAAIKAMEARHARLLADGRDEEARKYLLSDPDDQSEYMSVQMWKDNVLNVCMPSSYRFLRTVVEELAALYAEAGATLTTLHTGGDEVPHGVWEKSPACERFAAENEVEGAGELAAHFLREMSDLLDEHGLVTAGWEEIALHETTTGDGRPAKVPNKEFVQRDFRPYVWNNVWGWGAEDLGYRLANAGYPIVMCGATNLYFDLAYDKDPQEPGYYWAGFVDTKKTWELVPFDVFKSGREDLMGYPLDPQAFQKAERLTRKGRRNVLGIQGQLWSENAKGQELMEYLAFPKLLGLAERAWAAQPAWARLEDRAEREQELLAAWNDFANRLGQRELPRLDHLFGGVGYRLPPPGAVVEDGVLRANVAFPGLRIRYTTDGSEPTESSPLYSGEVAVEGSVRLRTFDRRGRGSRTVSF